MARTKIVRKQIRRAIPTNNIVRAITFICTSTFVLSAVALSYYLHTHGTQFDNFLDKLSKSEILKPIAQFVKTHKDQTVGVLLAGTSALTALPTTIAPAIAIAVSAAIYSLPTAPYLEYLLLTFSTLIFFKVRGSKSKLITLILIFATLALGWWGTKLFSLG